VRIHQTDTITAIATPPGTGGVGIVRISGHDAANIAQKICQRFPDPRIATFTRFFNNKAELMDEGIVIFFPSPASFTGEDVVELHGHGGQIVLNNIIKTVINYGARLARPGEFSERSFLNGKLDLVQVEAIADLIESSTEQAAKLATRTLNGEFSKRIEQLRDRLIGLRSFIEASVDFPEDDIGIIQAEDVTERLNGLCAVVARIFKSANQGRLLRDGINVVIAGRPNSGKSSLLNALAGCESAIVTPIPGTTRDLLKERIHLDGLPLHIIDTAGLREISDVIEQEGIRRAKKEIEQADCILWIYENNDIASAELDAIMHIQTIKNIIWINNKIDLKNQKPGIEIKDGKQIISLSAKTGAGVDLLRENLKESVGYNNLLEGEFIARQRHLDALKRVSYHLEEAGKVFNATSAGELLAEELRLAQNALSEITGEFVTDDLLDEVFSRFCIGK